MRIMGRFLRYRMGHKLALALGCPLLLFGASVCGGGSQIVEAPSPEAKVVPEVRLEPSPTKEPYKPEPTNSPAPKSNSPEAKSTAIVTAKTTEPLPTPTKIPSTVTPTNSPAPKSNSPEAKSTAIVTTKTTEPSPTPTKIPSTVTSTNSPVTMFTPIPVATTLIPNFNEPLHSDDFEDSLGNDWSLETGWQFSKENGNTVLLGRDHYWARLNPGADWTNYSFKFRLKLHSEAVHLNYLIGENPFSRYFLSFSEQGLSLSKQVGDDFTEMMDSRNSYRMNTWYTVEIRGFAGRLQVLVDDLLEMDLTDQQPLLKGTIAFESLSGSEVLIDDIEIWPVTEPLPEPLTAPQPSTLASLAGSITDLSERWIDPNSMHNYTYRDRDEVPLASGITVVAQNGSGNISITGAPGTIPIMAANTGKDWLRLVSVDWGEETCVRYGSNGSFSIARLNQLMWTSSVRVSPR